MTYQSISFATACIAGIGGVFSLGWYVGALFYRSSLLSKDAEIESIRGRLRSALKDVADKRNEVIQLTRDVQGEIERGDKLFEENRRLKRADQPRSHGRFAPKLKVAA